jgi:HemY protein
MIRVFVLIILMALTVGAVGWFAADPGAVVLDFRGWRLETTVGVLVLGVALVVAIAIVLWAGLHWVIAAPRRWRAWRAARRQSRGLKALAAGMVAVAAGDTKGARRAARRAALAEGETPLTLLLAAQAAQLEGDTEAARKFFTAMLAQPETEFLGIRGLLVQAGRDGDDTRALALAERAVKLRPDAGWAHAAMFELSVKTGAWKAAETALTRSVKRGGLTREQGNHHRAVLLLMQARDCERQGLISEALGLAKRAARAVPDLAPAALMRARLETGQGHAKRARRLLERAFADAPHPDIARAFLAFAEGAEEALVQDRLRLAARLLKRAPAAAEAHVTAAGAALEAQLWGKARQHLDDAEACLGTDEAPGSLAPARYFRLRARIEEAESGDARTAGQWLLRASNAPADPRWVCRACGEVSAEWHGVCGRCGGFDTMDWRSPAPVGVIGAESPVMTSIAAKSDDSGLALPGAPPSGRTKE